MDFSFLPKFQGRQTSKAIADAIALSIESGLLVKGDRLPSARELALCIPSSRTTVVHAINHLVAKGYLVSVKGDATYVSYDSREKQNISAPSDALPPAQELHQWPVRYSEMALKLLEQPADFVTSGDLSELNYGALPGELLPLRTWRKLLSEHCQGENLLALAGKQDVFGYWPDLLRRNNGIRCQAEQIVLFSGSQSALSHLMQLLVKPGDLVICENPSYAGARELFRINGAEVKTVPYDEEGPSVEALRAITEKADWLYLSQSCQDPIGVVLSQKRRRQILDWAHSCGASVIEDGWDSDFKYGGNLLPSLHSLDCTGSVIYAHTFWRLLFPLASTAFLVLPQELIQVFKNSKHIADHQHPLIEHFVLTKFINDGDFENHVRASWKILKARRQAMIFEFKQNFGDGIEILSPGAAMHRVVRFVANFREEVILKAAAQVGLPLVSTASYYAGETKSNEFIVPFSSISLQEIKDAVQSFATLVSSDSDI